VGRTDLTVESEFPVDKDELTSMLRAGTIKPILSGKDEFWEAFKCLDYDSWSAPAPRTKPPRPVHARHERASCLVSAWRTPSSPADAPA